METLRTLLDPILVTLGKVTGFVPTLISAILILIIGVYVSKIVKDLLDRILKEIKIDKVIDALGVGDILRKGGVKHPFSHIVTGLVYLIVVISFFLLAVESIGLTMMTDLFYRILGYVPSVISAVLVLVLGMIVAHVVGKIVHVAAHATKMPNPKLFDRISRWAIVLYAAVMSLGELGYGYLLTGKNFHILFMGIVFAYSLAFGLGGKDKAARYLDKK